jgi:hypothetical protein
MISEIKIKRIYDKAEKTMALELLLIAYGLVG